jgi:hypothetical protein
MLLDLTKDFVATLYPDGGQQAPSTPTVIRIYIRTGPGDEDFAESGTLLMPLSEARKLELLFPTPYQRRQQVLR